MLLIFTISCSSVNRSRKDVATYTLALNGGVFHKKEWNDKLIFKRYSWYAETILQYDILLAKLDADSNFAMWMEAGKYKMENCQEFYIGLFYAKTGAAFSTSYLLGQIEQQQTKANILPDFSKHLEAHPNLRDWRLDGHKVLGLCRNDINKKPYVIEIPGFETFKLK